MGQRKLYRLQEKASADKVLIDYIDQIVAAGPGVKEDFKTLLEISKLVKKHPDRKR
jgi:hypothetical protein